MYQNESESRINEESSAHPGASHNSLSPVEAEVQSNQCHDSTEPLDWTSTEPQQAAHDPDHDSEWSDDNPLEAYTAFIESITCWFSPEHWPVESIVRRPHPKELFTIVGPPLVIPGFVEDLHCECGNLLGQSITPLDSTLREKFRVPEQQVLLYPGKIFPETPFILPHIPERRSSESTDRDYSLAAIIEMASESWLKMWYAEDDDIFQCSEPVEASDAPPYPHFIWDLLHVIGEAFPAERDHPLHLLVREQRRLHKHR